MLMFLRLLLSDECHFLTMFSARVSVEESEAVAEAQNKKWDPVINWFNAR